MNRALALVIACAAFAAALAGAAEEGTYRKLAGRFSVYLSVVPAELIRGPLQPDARGASPQRSIAPPETHDVVVAVFDSASGLRVEGLKLTARVAAPGLAGEKRDLEPIRFAGQVVYANSFPMLGHGLFRIDVEVQAHDRMHRQEVTFYFAHPSFAPSKQRTSKETGND